MVSTFSNLLCHLVFSTKNREPLITPAIQPELHRYVGGIVHNGCGIAIEIGGMPDHVHMLVKLRPDVSVSDTARLIKANSSRWANERIPGFAWQNGYGAFTVSESQAQAVREYIRGQEDHHRMRTFQEEYTSFLIKNGIDYNEKYLWG